MAQQNYIREANKSPALTLILSYISSSLESNSLIWLNISQSYSILRTYYQVGISFCLQPALISWMECTVLASNTKNEWRKTCTIIVVLIFSIRLHFKLHSRNLFLFIYSINLSNRIPRTTVYSDLIKIHNLKIHLSFFSYSCILEQKVININDWLTIHHINQIATRRALSNTICIT